MHQSLYQQGLAQAAASNFAAAIALFDQVLQLCPNDATAYYQRGLAYFKSNQIPAAISDYTRALWAEPQNSGFYYARALAYLSQGNLDPAVADAKDAIRLRMDFAAAYDLLGKVRQRQNQVTKAVASYRKAAELYLDQQDITNGRRCLERLRQLQPAPAAPAKSTSVLPSPLSPDEFLQQAIAKAKLKDYSSALEDLDWAIQIDAQDPRIYVCRAEVKANFEDWTGAIDDYRQAARLYLNQGDQEKTRLILNRIEQLQVVTIHPQPIHPQPVKPQPPRSPRRSAFSFSASSPRGKVSPEIQRKLLRLVGDDRKIAAGLVERLRQRNPGMPEDWYWGKAIYDLERDRR